VKVYLNKNVEKIGMAGEIIKVEDGYARNYLIPRGLGIEITPQNENFYLNRAKTLENRKEVIESQTSMLAEKIKALKVTVKRKMHDDGKLYGAVTAVEVVDVLSQNGVAISKSQVVFDSTIKAKGTFEVTIKLSSRLQPKIKLMVVPE
jgi:large subunit ribosomal protein L9